MKYQELNEGTLQKLFRSGEWFDEWDQQIGGVFRHEIRSMKVGAHRRVMMTISQDTISTIRSRIQNFYGSVTDDFDLIMHLTVRLIGMRCSITPLGPENRLITADNAPEWAWNVVPERREMWLEPGVTLTVSLPDRDVSVDFIGKRELIDAQTNHLLSVKRLIQNYGTMQEDGHFRMSMGMKYVVRRFLKRLPVTDHDEHPLAVVTDGYVGQTRQREIYRRDGSVHSLANLTTMILAWMRCCDAERNRPYATPDTQMMDRNARFAFKYWKEHLIIEVDDSTLASESLVVARLGKFEYVGFVVYSPGERDGEYSGQIWDISSRKYYADGRRET